MERSKEKLVFEEAWEVRSAISGGVQSRIEEIG
jgi:hypothetical protein